MVKPRMLASTAMPTTRPNQDDALIGTVVGGRHQILDRLARGGMAVVYRAHDQHRDMPTAVKVMSAALDVEDMQSFEQRFKREARTLARLDHPNIVALHDSGQLEDQRFYLAMDLVEGPNLDAVLGDAEMDVERALALTMQLCAALSYAHEQGVVHRDLKPSNLLLAPGDTLKVVDFGLAQLAEPDQSITDVGEVIGSPHCMAPEQVSALESDHRVDIYAIGIVLFRMLTGVFPFDEPNRMDTMISHINKGVPSLSSVAPELVLPALVEGIVRICLAKRPDDRYASVQALHDELRACSEVHRAAWVSTSVTATFVTELNTEIEAAVREANIGSDSNKESLWSWLFG